MNNVNMKIRTDADVGSADELVTVPGFMRTGFFDAVPQPDRGHSRA